MRTVAYYATLRWTSDIREHPTSTFVSIGNRSIARLSIRPEDIQEPSRLIGRIEATRRAVNQS